MNEPGGFTLNDAGKVVDVDPLEVIFNEAMPLRVRAHARRRVPRRRVPRRVGVRGRDAAGATRPVPPPRLPHRVHRRRDRDARSRCSSATPLARWVYSNEPMKFAAIELVPETSSDVPETLFGHLNDDGDVSGGIPIPGLASILSDPLDGTSTVIQGLDAFPADERPTTSRGQHRAPRVGRDGRPRHAAHAAVRLVRAHVWLFRRDLPKSKLVPARRGGRRRAVGHRDGGRLGRHRGRATTVDRARPHEGRGRGDDERRACGSRSS